MSGGRRGLGPRRPRQRSHHSGEVGEPRKSDLPRRGAVPLRNPQQRRVAREPSGALDPAQRAVGEHADAALHALADQTAAQRTVLPRIQLDLHRGADLGDPAVALQRRESANAGRERHPRIGRVQLVEVDALDAESAPAGGARGGEVARPPVRNPAAAGAREPALGSNAHARGVARPARERAGDEPLVVAELAVARRVDVGGVEQGDAGVECRVQHGDGARLVDVARRQPHAADGDLWTSGPRYRRRGIHPVEF